MYRGLPVVTNKIPKDEMNDIPHHLLDQIGLQEQPWTVHEFVKESSKIIEGIRDRGRLPIVVGGTSYYVQSLLFNDSTLKDTDDADMLNIDTTEGDSKNAKSDLTILNASTEEMYSKLLEVDPDIARSWHPNDRRHIQRSLEIWLKTGRKASEWYETQKTANTGSTDLLPRLRFDSLVLWLDAEDQTLKRRLNDRVDIMLKQGLLDEIRAMREFEDNSRSENCDLDLTKGIWVAIGYKELIPWLDRQRDLDNQYQKSLKQLETEGIESIKAGTRQYAKRQNRWIRIRLANALQDANMLHRLFLLDCTSLQGWNQNVSDMAAEIVKSFLAGTELPSNDQLSELAARIFSSIRSRDEKVVRQTHFCDTCNKTLMDEHEWKKHLRSQGHKKILDGIRKRQKREEYFRNATAAV